LRIGVRPPRLYVERAGPKSTVSGAVVEPRLARQERHEQKGDHERAGLESEDPLGRGDDGKPRGRRQIGLDDYTVTVVGRRPCDRPVGPSTG